MSTLTPGTTITPRSSVTAVPTASATLVLSSATPALPAPKMALIAAGPFQMGSAQYSDQQPVHTVNLGAFKIDIYEVSNAHYGACVAAGACRAPAEVYSHSRMDYYTNPEFANYPVVYVTWQDAGDYCAWRGARLPTEAEWEKAARGGLEGKVYPWGDDPPGCNLAAKNGAQSYACILKDTVPVGSYGANGYGLFDMAGNAYEWVGDWYGEAYYRVSPAKDPPGPARGEFKILRGGSWSFRDLQQRVAHRYGMRPDLAQEDIGFRCALSVP